MRLNILFFTIFTLSILGCKKEKSQNLIDGTYKGTFKVAYASGVQTGNTTITLKGGYFTCKGNENYIPAGGSGLYSFTELKINFEDHNLWTANFDGNLILSGNYNYTFDGQKLIIFSQRTKESYYEYNLVKQ
jgi:hypothetical protein